MPFINSKISTRVPDETRKAIRVQLGKDIAVLGKDEKWLMTGFEDNYDLGMAGDSKTPAAFVSVSLFGSADSAACEQLTAKICALYSDMLGIPGNRIYVKYEFVREWGWNGRNF